jgi:hypothetical protein
VVRFGAARSVAFVLLPSSPCGVGASGSGLGLGLSRPVGHGFIGLQRDRLRSVVVNASGGEVGLVLGCFRFLYSLVHTRTPICAGRVEQVCRCHLVTTQSSHVSLPTPCQVLCCLGATHEHVLPVPGACRSVEADDRDDRYARGNASGVVRAGLQPARRRRAVRCGRASRCGSSEVRTSGPHRPRLAAA